MARLQIKSRWDDSKILYEGEAETLRDLVNTAVAERVDLRGANLGDANLGDANLGDANLGDANLGGANLGDANLGGAYLGGANLRGAYLGDANLGGANLGDANLRGANLGGANHVFSFGGIGSAKRTTTYWLEAGKVWCGCFTGTLAEFVAQVEETHEDNPKFLAEYRAGIAFLEACVALIPEDEREAGRKAYAEMTAKTEAEFEAERLKRVGPVSTPKGGV